MDYGKDIVAIIMAIIGLAVIALLIKNAGGTSQVIGSATGGLSSLIATADTGGNSSGMGMSSNYSSYGLPMSQIGVY